MYPQYRIEDMACWAGIMKAISMDISEGKASSLENKSLWSVGEKDTDVQAILGKARDISSMDMFYISSTFCVYWLMKFLI